MEKKVNNVEFSPNGRFLYFTAGGYVASGTSNVTYLGQIDLNQTPFEVRLQVQTHSFPAKLKLVAFLVLVD